jgi:two-component system cell cycle sensor histidine kinase/response regulator CckA
MSTGAVQERSKTILVVDDEEPIRKLVVKVLLRKGFHVLQASDPKEAWKIWIRDREKIDLLFTDVILPMMSGPELASEFRRMRPELKVVFVTGSCRLAVAETMDLIPHKSFLEKPFTSAQLLDAISSTLAN